MKFLALAGLMTVSTSVLAADRSIVDLQYLPNAGTTYGFSDFSLLDITAEAFGSRSETTGYSFNQTVGHALTDRLSLQASIGYSSSENESTGSPTTEVKGISDPSVAAKFRLIDEEFRMDLLVGALISIGDDEVDSSGDSNNLQGGHDISVGTQIGAKKDNFQWALLGQITHNFESTTDDKQSGTKVDDDAHNELTLQAELLTKLSDISFIRTAFSANFVEEYEDENNVESDGSTSYLTNVEYRHLFSKELMFKVGVKKIDSPSTQAKLSAWTYDAGLNYQF